MTVLGCIMGKCKCVLFVNDGKIIARLHTDLSPRSFSPFRFSARLNVKLDIFV